MNNMNDKCYKVLHMQSTMPNGTIRDADTVLQDVFDETEPEITGLATEIIMLYLNSTDKDSVSAMFEAITGCSFKEYLDRSISAMRETYAREAICTKCHQHYSMIMSIIVDGNGNRFYCPNCMAKEADTMPLANVSDLHDDVTGEPGAVAFMAYKEVYTLEAERMRRLIKHTLAPDEVLALRKKYGADSFMLHDDFYDDEGNALQ
jgi:hypothetical protein